MLNPIHNTLSGWSAWKGKKDDYLKYHMHLSNISRICFFWMSPSFWNHPYRASFSLDRQTRRQLSLTIGKPEFYKVYQKQFAKHFNLSEEFEMDEWKFTDEYMAKKE